MIALAVVLAKAWVSVLLGILLVLASFGELVGDREGDVVVGTEVAETVGEAVVTGVVVVWVVSVGLIVGFCSCTGAKVDVGVFCSVGLPVGAFDNSSAGSRVDITTCCVGSGVGVIEGNSEGITLTSCAPPGDGCDGRGGCIPSTRALKVDYKSHGKPYHCYNEE
mmetsp:Transcript_603/g.1108  ORF Transcript_603/g.1108 Transcript_603/m.1108 type:complete len:165 (+) Transcript_603:129-623(+)